MPTVLLLHTEAPTLRVLARLRAEGGLPSGTRIVVATADPAPPGSACDDFLPLPDPADVRGTLAALEEYARRTRLDGIVPHAEYGILAGSILAARLGLPALSPRAALLCTDKSGTRRALSSAGVPQPRFSVASTADDVRRFARSIGDAPVVLKPAASTMGRWVARVAPGEDPAPAVARLREALPRAADVRRLLDFSSACGLAAACDPAREFLVEEWVEGDPLQSDGFSWEEGLDFFGVTGQVVSEPPETCIEGYLFPADIPAEVAARVRAVTEGAVRALGLREAAFCVELKLRDGLPRVIEVNGRLGEDEGLPEMLRAHLGDDPVALWIRRAAGGRGAARPRAPSGPRAAIAYASWPRPGTVVSVPRPEDVASLVGDGRLRAEVLVEPGTRLHEISHPESSPHLAYALATDTESSRAAYARAREAVGRLPVAVTT